MSRVDADGVRDWLAWVLHGEWSWTWLRPRRALLPAASLWGLLALVTLHEPWGRFEDPCTSPARCQRLLSRQAAEEPLALAGAVGAHLLAAVVVYALAVGTTSLAGHWLDLRGRAPRLFAPDDTELLALAVVHLAALVAYAAGVVGAVYTSAGVAVVYVLFFPLLVAPTAFVVATGALGAALSGPVPAAVTAVLVAVVFLALPVAQVLWLYALAHGAVAAMRAGE